MKPYQVTRINKDVGAKVLIKTVLVDINPKDGWKYIKNVRGTIIQKAQSGIDGYYYTSSGACTHVNKHIISEDIYLQALIQLPDGMVDIAGNNIIPVRKFDFKYLERKVITKQRKSIDLKDLVSKLDDEEIKELKKLLEGE